MHRYSFDADMRSVHKRLAGNAGIAQAAEHSPRKREDGFSSDPTGSSFEVDDESGTPTECEL